MKKLSILGSTGSIGVNTLEIVAQHPERFQVVALGGGRNLKKMEEQILRFRPRIVSVLDAPSARALRARIAAENAGNFVRNGGFGGRRLPSRGGYGCFRPRRQHRPHPHLRRDPRP